MSAVIEKVTVVTTVTISISLPGPRLMEFGMSVEEARSLWDELGKALRPVPLDMSPGQSYNLRDAQGDEGDEDVTGWPR